jgi:small subunit ribosomal protein S6
MERRAEISQTERKMPYYENVFIARQDISATQVDTLTDTFAGAIENMGGTVAKREYWGLKNLAYRIKKNRKGHYVLLNLDAPADAVQEMERQMRINEDILRYLTVRIDELEEGPSVMMQSRGDRRGGRGFGDDREAGRRGPRRDGPADAEPAKDAVADPAKEAVAEPAAEAAAEPAKEAAAEPAAEVAAEPAAEGDEK